MRTQKIIMEIFLQIWPLYSTRPMDYYMVLLIRYYSHQDNDIFWLGTLDLWNKSCTVLYGGIIMFICLSETIALHKTSLSRPANKQIYCRESHTTSVFMAKCTIYDEIPGLGGVWGGWQFLWWIYTYNMCYNLPTTNSPWARGHIFEKRGHTLRKVFIVIFK